MRWKIRASMRNLLLLSGCCCFVVLLVFSTKATVFNNVATSSLRGGGEGVNISVPLYFINMDEDSDRRAYMESVFGSVRSKDEERVKAIKTTEMNLLIKYFDPRSIPDAAKLRKDKHYETYRIWKALPGQLGNTLSHLRAVERAYESGHEYAVIMEDDAGDVSTHLWPSSNLSLYIRAANKLNSKWSAIRLQWNDYDWHIDKLRKEWHAVMTKWSRRVSQEQLEDITRHWRFTGSIPESLFNTLPLMQPWGRGWGNVCTLFSRRGMKRLLDFHRTYKGVSESDHSLWKCNPDFPCQADITFWQELGEDEVFITTPPLVTYRLAEVQTKAIRQGEVKKDHKTLHLQSVLNTLKWLMELQEYTRPGGGWKKIPGHKWVVFP
eukprot:Blabericola_migrator_1__1591@NODE_1422_length_4576_cov_143_286316_g946_i0_p3_GENE_NODE_1422_length_4576_cov_143_286316_g946_i0NODE_1422_length_4576_cov_143_286316_g946_i0_p3_ORF_typecomplete_len379_score57_74Glyco_transf_25/PF01755_17/4_2e19_NODE_1422_length_4576_cov_143_286316_g946_i014102546